MAVDNVRSLLLDHGSPVPRVTVFSYDFPHRKSQDGLLRLIALGVNISEVIAAPWKQLNLRGNFWGRLPMSAALQDSRTICRAHGIPYMSAPHDSDEVISHLKAEEPELGVILGSRILPSAIINEFSLGVLNVHPGLLPGNAGLNNVEWAILRGSTQGITAHLIDARVDAGWLIQRVRLTSIDRRASIRDLRQTLADLELSVMRSSLKVLGVKNPVFPGLGSDRHLNGPLTVYNELRAASRWQNYKKNYSDFVVREQKAETQSLATHTVDIAWEDVSRTWW